MGLSGPLSWGSAAALLCLVVWDRSFLPHACGRGGLGETELIKRVGKALCGSMLTNSKQSSLELAHVGKPTTKAAWTRLRDSPPGEGQ